MFGFFRKKNIDKNDSARLLPLQTDIHSHILPGIDDGSPDIETSIKLVKGLYQLGIRKTIATPHVISDLYRNTPETINSALLALRQAVKEEGIEIEINAAAEYMLDDYFIKLLKTPGDLLTLYDNVILTEQSYATPSSNLHEISFALLTAGLKPIMAHPERYAFYHGDNEAYSNLKDMGFMLQINLLSFTGYYGKPAAKAARYILDNGLADFVGTDLHHFRHLAALSDPRNLQLFNNLLKNRSFNQI